eukprot:GHVN01069327.1.p1 GENE.GHVN01069327.1~~GHVN01069327.1.p1  ORF type:complete len:199 (+),score=11.38 GHVN01069327.1:751-1347(+)
MLGQGRPFLVEVMEPDLSVCIEADTCRGLLRYANMDPHMFEVTRLIREVSGGRVEVEQLAASVEDSQQVNHNFRTLQQLCEEKTKVYGCVVWLADHMSKDGLEETFKFIKLPIVLQQQTPIRVLHRRKNDTRERAIYTMKSVWLTHHTFYLVILAQAGTYIKEFVHGDLGRTIPSCGSVMGTSGKIGIVSLDVLELMS